MEKKKDSLIHCSDDKEDADASEENGLVLENQENDFDLNFEPTLEFNSSSSTPAVVKLSTPPPFSSSASTQNNNNNLVIAMPENSIPHDNLQTSSPMTNTNTNSNRNWTEEEHKNFLAGLRINGKGKWKEILQNVVNTKTPRQVTSHAEKYFKRQELPKEMHKRPTINDVNTVDDGYVNSLSAVLQKEASQSQPNSNSEPENTNTNSNTSKSHSILNYSEDRVLADEYVKTLVADLQEGVSQSQPNSVPLQKPLPSRPPTPPTK